MKEFDLEKAKAGAPVCTRDGRPARIICWDAKGGTMHILALITEKNRGCEDIELVSYYYDNGKCSDGSDSDLMMAPVKHEGWVYLYKEDGCQRSSSYVYKTARDAVMAAQEIVPGKDSWVVKIEWEE